METCIETSESVLSVTPGPSPFSFEEAILGFNECKLGVVLSSSPLSLSVYPLRRALFLLPLASLSLSLSLCLSLSLSLYIPLSACLSIYVFNFLTIHLFSYTLLLKSLGSLRNVLISSRKAPFFSVKITLN